MNRLTKQVYAITLVALLSTLACYSAPLQLTNVTLPSGQPNSPILWSKYSAAELGLRSVDADYSADYNSFKSFVDVRIGNLAGQADNNLGRFAKGAAILELMGKTPPAGSPYATYGAAAVAAINGLGPRNPRTNIFQVAFPPTNATNILQDSGTLQSVSEAYDMLRGSAAFTANQATMVAKIDDWADAIKNDYQLTNLSQGESNWAIKAGSALVTTSLAIREESNAASYLSSGVTYINQSFTKMIDETGYNSEGAYYSNYSLNNLIPAAHHVKAVTGTDWFADMEPIIRYGLDTKLPDGTNPAFEEGLRANMPYELLWGEYDPATGGELRHASDIMTATPVTSNVANQQLIAATRFLSVDQSVLGAAATTSPTRFIESNAVKAATLRTSHGVDGLQVNVIGAVDHSASELTNSRHNSKNFGDLVLAGNGRQLLVTSTGGNQVTSTNAADRANFINNPSWKNVPLVNGDSEYITDPTRLGMVDQLDSVNAGGQTNSYMESASISATGIGGTQSINRTSSIINQSSVVVTDAFKSTSSNTYSQNWHGRGTRVTATSGTSSTSTWTDGTDKLSAYTVGTGAITASAVNRLYAESYGAAHENIEGIQLSVTGTDASLMTVFYAGTTTGDSPVFTQLGTSNAMALGVEMNVGTERTLFANAEGGSMVTVGGALGMESNGTQFTLTEESGVLVAFSLLNGSNFEYTGITLYEGALTDISVQYSNIGVLAVLGDESNGVNDYYLAKASLPNNTNWQGVFNGVLLDATQFEETTDGFWFRDLDGGGQFWVTPVPEPSSSLLLGLGAIFMIRRRSRK